jgi:hypothetical protein
MRLFLLIKPGTLCSSSKSNAIYFKGVSSLPLNGHEMPTFCPYNSGVKFIQNNVSRIKVLLNLTKFSVSPSETL